MQDMASDGYATSDDESSSEADSVPPAAGSDDEIDMEDLGGRIKSGKTASTSQPSFEQPDPAAAREMLTPALRANLSKQGYKLIGGDHSASMRLQSNQLSVYLLALCRPCQAWVHSP